MPRAATTIAGACSAGRAGGARSGSACSGSSGCRGCMTGYFRSRTSACSKPSSPVRSCIRAPMLASSRGVATRSTTRAGAPRPAVRPRISRRCARRRPSEATDDWDMIEFLMVAGAPTPVAPFSHAVAADGWLFVTGQMPTDPADDAAPLPEGVEAQTRRVVENLKLVLAGAGSALDRVVFARVYLTHFERDYAAMNAVWRSCFAEGRLPARTCVGVTGLARGALVEIDLLAKR